MMRNIDEGFGYFTTWLDEVMRADNSFSITATKCSPFLSWQTWDLLRISVSGIKGMLRDFTRRNPGYFLVPSRINGSAIESLFSQIEYATAGKLTSTNYASSRRAVIVSANVHSENCMNKDYRDDKLNID